MPGRTRVALKQPAPGRDALDRLAEALAAVAGIEAVEIRPHTGSLIIRHGQDFDPASEAVLAAGLRIVPSPESGPPLDPIQETIRQLARAEETLSRLTGGRADLWNIAFVALLAGGVAQLARGRIAGPAVTLFSQAATIAMARPLRMFVR